MRIHGKRCTKQTNQQKKSQIKNQTWHLILQKSPRVFKWSAGERLHSSCDVTRLFIWGRAGKGHWWCLRRMQRARGTGLSSSASVGQHSETKMQKEWAHRVLYVMQKVKGNRRGTIQLVFVHCIEVLRDCKTEQLTYLSFRFGSNHTYCEKDAGYF